jgi:hypothetical protein
VSFDFEGLLGFVFLLLLLPRPVKTAPNFKTPQKKSKKKKQVIEEET